MCLRDGPILRDDPFDGLTPRQMQAAALWLYGDSSRPLSQREVARRLGVSQPAAHKLIRKAMARLRSAGIEPVRAAPRRLA